MANADKFLEELEKQKKKKKKRGEDTSSLEPIAPSKEDITGDDQVNSFFDALNTEREKLRQRESVTWEDIAPVKPTVGTTDRVHGGRGGSFTVKSEEDDSLLDFFQKGAFSDGYQVGDVSKAILGTVGDIGVGAVKGVMKLGEGIGDAAQYGVAAVADAFGGDEWADKVRRNAQRTAIDDAFAPVDKKLDRYSVSGRTLDAASEAIGQIGGIIATGGIAGMAGAGAAGATAATTGVMGLSSFGSSTGEAYKGGAETGEAELFGAIAGTADAVSELIFGGLGKAVGAVGLSKGLSSADDILAKKVSEKITNTIAKNAVQLGIKAGAEGTEEVLAGLAQAAGKKLTYMSEEEIGQIIADENLLEQFVVGAMASGVAQVPSFAQANKTDTDFITGRTKNEQAVIDRVVEQRVKDAESDGTKLKPKQRQEIEEQAASDMERGRIDIETIEEVLGGEDYQTYQTVIKNEDALRKEYEELGALKEPTLAEKTRYEELHAKKAEIFSDERRTALKSKVSERVSQMAGQDRLAASFTERARRGEYFTEDVSKYKSDAAKKTVQNLVESKLANNTGRTHDMAETVAKIAEDKGIVFNFTNNQKLRESGKTAGVAENAIINGYKDAEGITVNLDSPKAWQFIVGHEVTHTLEGTAEYTELANAVKVYAQTKGEYDSRKAAIASLYAEGTDVDSELTSDMIGEYIFTDEQFVTELSTKHQNVFQKVFAEIKHLLKIVTAGSKEARQLERVKHTFEKAYRAQRQTQNVDTGVDAGATADDKVQYSLADPETDAEYLKAVNAYDTIKARRMVREAARAAGYNSPLLYHGTLSFGFTKFRASKSYYRTAVFATDDIDTVRTYSYKDKAREIKDRTMEDRRGNYQLYGNTDGFLEVDGRGAAWNDIDFEPLRGEDGAKSNTNQIVAYAKKNGYKGVIIRSIWDDGGAPGARQKKPSDVYAFFDPGSQLKSADPVTYDNDGNVIPLSERFKAENKDVRFSLTQDSEGRQLSETEVQATNETLHDVGVQYDADSETVSYSLSSLEEAFAYNRDEEEYRAAREEYVTALAKATGKSTAEANRYLDSLFLVHDMIAADRDRLDYEAAVDRSAWVSNAEYGGSIDFSTLCAKRRLFTGTFDAIQQKLPDTVLNENDFLRIRNLLLEKGLESPCSMCYVEGSRAKHGVYVKKFLDDYLKTDPAWKPQIADFTSTTRLEQTRIQHPEAYAAYTKAMNALSQRKPKEASVRTDYKGEILEAFKNDTTVAEKNKNGGVRFNSFSDFEIIHALDAMQVLTDMSRVGLNGQAYTKVKEFAEAFGNTGLKINLSLVAKGVDADGKLIMDETNGMNYAEALDIRRRYSENVGTVIVVFNDAQLKAALADSTIDYVLPFHRSQWKKSQYTMMGLPTETRDYTNIQNDRYKNPTTGRAKKAPDGNIMPNEYWDFNLSGRENAQKYLDYINEHGYIPKFDHVLNKVDGKWVLPDGAVGDGYYKLLIDFKMYDNDGWGSPQRPVLPEFNMPYIQRMLDDYVGGHQAFPVAHDVVDAFVAEKTGKRSLSAANEAPTGRGTAARELRYQGEAEDIAPVQQAADAAPTAETIPGEHSEIDRLNAEYDAVRAEFDEISARAQETYSDLSPEEQERVMDEVLAVGERLKAAQDALNVAQQENLASYTDADVPPEMDAPYYGDEEQAMPDDPMADRDEDTVGNRSVKAYQYLNPEVKPYFQTEANAMLGDLRRATRGERMVTWDTAGNGGKWTGQKRVLQYDLAGLKDQYGYSYEQLEKGIQAIIDDEGAENNAVSKRIELLIHERLAKGYVDAYSGVEIPANTEYLDFLREKQITEYYDANFDALMADADAHVPPITEDIAPVAEAAPVADPLAGVSSAVDTEVEEIDAPVADTADADADAEADGVVGEIQTTYDKILAKKQNAEATLEAHKAERAARAELYQKRIDELQRKLDGKKRKDTKAAVKLAQQITRVRELAANVDADYAKRISDAEKRIARRDFELNQDHTEADKLERAYAKIDQQLALDRAAVEEEFAQRREELSAAIADKNTYIGERAKELYSELSHLKKGVRASYELGYLLDHGYDWRTLKSTLLKVNLQPDAVINPESAEESVIREMLNEEYASKTFEIDELDGEMQDRLAELEADAEKQKAEVRKSEQQLRRSQHHANLVDGMKNDFALRGYDLDMVLKDANNLSTFATVDNTPQRVMEKALGYKQGQILADLTVNKTAQNESEGIRWLNQYTDPKNGLIARISRQYHIKPGSKESAAAQMYAEGFWVNQYNEIIEYGDRELAADFPDVKTQAMIKGLARDGRIRAIYDETLDAINESRVRNAYPEIPKRKDYFLHFRAMEDTFSTLGLPFNPNDIRAKDLPTDLNGVTADLKPGQPYFASSMQRKGKRTSFDLLGGLEKYLSSAKNQIYHIDDIQTLRALRNYIADDYGQAKGLDSLDALSEEEVQERIKDVFGSHLSTFAKFLNEQANVIAGKTSLADRGIEGIIGRRGITFLNDLNRQVGANMVGYNISSSLTNFIAPVQAFAKMNKGAFIKGFAQTVSNRIGGIFGRGDSFAADSSVMIRREGEKRFHRTAWQRMSDPGYLLMGAVDSLSTEIITRGKVNELMKNGMEYGQALYEADKWVSRLMGDRSLGQQPHLYNSKMLGLITKFQLEVRNQLDSQFYDTIKEAEVSTETIENAKKRNAVKAAKIASTFATLAVGQHIFGQVFESIAGYNPAFDIIEAIIKAAGWDDDEDDDDTVLDNLGQGLLSLAEDMPYYSILSGGRVPIESALPLEQLIKGKDNYGNDKSRLETLAEAAPYYVLPGGYGQIKKTAAGLDMYSDEHPVAGSYTDSGNMRFPVGTEPLDVAQAAVFGQYSSANARDYFDNERKPLTKEQVGEYAAADMTIQDYWRYRDGLKEHEKLADQAEYINSLDIPTWKKNLFINNLTDRKEAIDMADYGQYGSLSEMDFAKKSPEKYRLLKEHGVTYEQFTAFDDKKKNAYSWAAENPEKYSFVRDIGYTIDDYARATDTEKDAWNWAYNNPEKYLVSRAVSDDLFVYRGYTDALNDIKADKDADGKSISGSRKDKVVDYLNELDLDYGAKIILLKSEYPSEDSYNYDIIDYLNEREDITAEEMTVILTQLGFRVTSDGTITWD